jgi:uncharacterized protein YyaL (SSP411 family)
MPLSAIAPLFSHPRDQQENARPSGNAITATTVLKLAGFTNDLRTNDIAHQARTKCKA